MLASMVWQVVGIVNSGDVKFVDQIGICKTIKTIKEIIISRKHLKNVCFRISEDKM